MLIGIDASRAFVARRTGTETYSFNLIRALIGLGTAHRFRLYVNEVTSPPAPPLRGEGSEVTSPPAPPLRGEGSEVTSPPAPPLRGEGSVEIRAIPFPRLWTHVRLSAEMLVRPPDVLFVPAHVLPLVHPQRCVVTVHDLGYLRYPEAHRPADRRYLDWSTRWNARQATVVLADSQATKDDLVRAYGVDPDKVRVVYLGREETLGPVRDPARLAAVRERYGLGRRYLLYVGTLQPRKNLARVIEAFARIAGRPASADVQLVLAGKRGWLYDDLFAQVERMGLGGRVLLPGYVAEADLPALLSGALAFVFPSLYEGFGIPVLEAGACEVPVITSNTSSLPEVAGDAALFVDPHDVDAIAEAMYRLITDPDLRADLIRRGRENVRRFSWEKCARETLAVLEEVGRRGDKAMR
ncbi:MAG: glycosyltransferase family 4 protein [Anaerolineae bacterium]